MRNGKTLKEKLKSKAAFTLAETLITVLIMLCVSVVVATGIPAAFAAARNIVLSANAEVLMSTTVTSLRNELGTAKDIKLERADINNIYNRAIVYYNKTLNTTSQIYLAEDPGYTDSDQTIMIDRYHSTSGIPAAVNRERLVSREASGNELYATFGYITYRDNILVIHNLKIKGESTLPDSKEGKVYASRDTVSIRTIASEKQE